MTAPHPRHGCFETEPTAAQALTARLDRLSDLAECEHLSDDTRELLRWAAASLAVLTFDHV